MSVPQWFVQKPKSKISPIISRQWEKNQNVNRPKLIQEPISVKFKNDYNIRSLDEIIRDKLRNEILSVDIMRKSVEDLKRSLTNVTTIIAYDNTMQKILDMEEEMRRIENGSRAITYVNESKPILERYSKIPRPTKYIDLGKEQDTEDEFDEYVDLRIKCIIDFLNVANNYIQLDIVRDKPKQVTNRCKGCGCDLREVEVMIDGHQVCQCGLGRYKTKMDKVIESGDKTTSATKEYNDETNFKKALIRFVGGQKISFDIDTVCNALDKYFISIGHRPAEYYRNLPLTLNKKKEGTSLELLLSGLKAIGCPKLYEDANVIGMHLWGWELHDLSEIIENIMNDYKETQAVFEAMPIYKRGRKSCLSTQLRLYGHLRMRGVNVEKKDFKIPKQKDSIHKQNDLWIAMCEGTGNPNIYAVSLL